MDENKVCATVHLVDGYTIETKLDADDLERVIKYAGEGSAIHLHASEHESVYINWNNVTYVEVVDL